MYINGFYLDGIPHEISRNEDLYEGIDILITNKPSVYVGGEILGDYKSMGSIGYSIWSSLWPHDIELLGSSERLDLMSNMSCSDIGKELLFFRRMKFYEGENKVIILHSLGKVMSNLNVSFILRALSSLSHELQVQLLIILDMDIYRDYKVSNSISPKFGSLII